MGRKTIKMDPAREDYEVGAFLERDERFETDAEWHGRVLDSIDMNLNSLLQEIQANIPDAARTFDAIEEQLRAILDHLQQQPSNDAKPVSNWRFLFNWAMLLLIFWLFKAF